MRNVLGLKPVKPGLKLDIKKNKEENTAFLKVAVEAKIFGPQPFLAIKTVTGQYYWDNFDVEQDNIWSYTFDQYTVNLNAIDKIGVAANSPQGVTEVIVYDNLTGNVNKMEYNL